MSIDVVGIGLDGAAGLSNKVLQVVAMATVLVGSDRHLHYFTNHPAICLKLGDLEETAAKIKDYWQEGAKIVVLVTGDPLFFGLGRFLLAKFPPEELNFYPHLTSVQLAFNRLKIPWQDATIVSIHGRDCDGLIEALKRGGEKIAVLTDYHHNPATIWQIYQHLNLPIVYDFWLCENLGGGGEKITCYSGGVNIDRQQVSGLNVVILIRQKSAQKKQIQRDDLPLIGIPDRYFLSFEDRPGLMTKKEIRLIILGELELQDRQIVWDIGAGIGTISIEIARLCPNSQVYALEKTAIGASIVKSNAQNFQLDNLICYQGKAPEILTDLPQPDRIFIGGSGGKIRDILAICQDKIKPHGKIAITAATLETCHESISWFQGNKWTYHVLNVQISRSLAIANLTRFSPLNPVMIVTARLAE